ncbi:hypothetical protein GCM10022384_53640 [Streptomyces marokkonensis]|uniref:Uncharacterized protein n=1 Tax=Streptomyces marokkonensis TaxID=324855 RepID=A0ABP7RP53_9ACTN
MTVVDSGAVPSTRATAASDRPGAPLGTTAASARTAAARRVLAALTYLRG